MIRTGNAVSNALISLPKTIIRVFMVDGKNIDFWEMPLTTRFELEANFREKLFSKAANEGYFKLASCLDVSYAFISPLKRGVYSIPLKTLLRLGELTGINNEEIQKNITFTRTRHGKGTKSPYPIFASPIVASLVGHVFGDGYISEKKRQFEYVNFDSNLRSIAEKEVYDAFRIQPISRKEKSIVFPSITGDILLAFGCLVSPKLYSTARVPEWIMNGTPEMKKAFLRAIFDDDGSVMFSEDYRAKGVNLAWTRHENHSEPLKLLLLDVKKLLSEFDIHSGEPIVTKIEQYEDGNHVTMYINITDHQSIKNYYEKIGFNSKSKHGKLEKILLRKFIYTKARETQMLMQVMQKIILLQPVSTGKLAQDLKLAPSFVLKKLKKLEKTGAIEQNGRVALNRSIIWKVKG